MYLFCKIKLDPPTDKKSFKMIYGSEFMSNVSKKVKERIESTLVWEYDWLKWKTDDPMLYDTNRKQTHQFHIFFDPWIKWDKEIREEEEDSSDPWKYQSRT